VKKQHADDVRNSPSIQHEKLNEQRMKHILSFLCQDQHCRSEMHFDDLQVMMYMSWMMAKVKEVKVFLWSIMRMDAV
jgi:hypothetical protein